MEGLRNERDDEVGKEREEGRVTGREVETIQARREGSAWQEVAHKEGFGFHYVCDSCCVRPSAAFDIWYFD